MKACKFCGTQVENTEQHCPSCGSTVFLNICENCGTRFESGFCPNCGVKAGQAKKVCPECRSVYFSNACPNCGYMPSRKPVVQKVEQTVVHRHVYEEPPRPAVTPTQARRVKKKNTGCTCLVWVMMILVLVFFLVFRSSGKKKTTSSARSTTAGTTVRTTRSSNTTAAPTATPEPAVLAAQARVDQYFKDASEEEIAAVKDQDSLLDQLDAEKSGKVIVVARGGAPDRGTVGRDKNEPSYIGCLGYAAVYDEQKLKYNNDFASTPWTVPVYRKDKQFWEEAGTMDHKAEVVVIGQELEMPSSRRYSSSRCSGYLRVLRVDTGEVCWLNIDNYVSSPYWEKSLTEAQESGYCIATFKQVSDYYPVTGGNEKVELEDGMKVLVPVRWSEYGTSPDKENNPVPCIVFKQWLISYGGVTVWFNEKDLTLTY